ncbi:pyruvate dehydrogenase E1 component beta subunit, partial [Striga asiatica]
PQQKEKGEKKEKSLSFHPQIFFFSLSIFPSFLLLPDFLSLIRHSPSSSFSNPKLPPNIRIGQPSSTILLKFINNTQEFQISKSISFLPHSIVSLKSGRWSSLKTTRTNFG